MIVPWHCHDSFIGPSWTLSITFWYLISEPRHQFTLTRDTSDSYSCSNSILSPWLFTRQAIDKGYIYAVEYPHYRGLESIGKDPFGTVIDAYSPIAIFASKPSRQTRRNRLKPVAIQLNSSKGRIARNSPSINTRWVSSAQLWTSKEKSVFKAQFEQAVSSFPHLLASTDFGLWFHTPASKHLVPSLLSSYLLSFFHTFPKCFLDLFLLLSVPSIHISFLPSLILPFLDFLLSSFYSSFYPSFLPGAIK